MRCCEKRKLFWSIALYIVIALITIGGIIVLIVVTNNTIIQATFQNCRIPQTDCRW